MGKQAIVTRGNKRVTTEILFIGTGAAEGVPAAFCRCPDCKGVRQRGGKEIRTRSSLRIGKHYQIDFSPDYYNQMLKHRTDLFDLEHLLITHSHGDHLAYPGLFDKTMSRVTNGKPLNIYLSEPAESYFERLITEPTVSASKIRWIEENLCIHPVKYFSKLTVGELRVSAVKGNHRVERTNEETLNYLIQFPSGTTLMYACDTGYYLEETWNHLEREYADILIMDCTFGGRRDRGEFPSGHLDIASFLRMLEKMVSVGFIDDSTHIFATHINPHQGLTHYAIQERFDESTYRVTVAYDGLRIEL